MTTASMNWRGCDMWLHDPYVIDELLRRRAEMVARAQLTVVAERPLIVERFMLAVRVLRDAALAARVRDSAIVAPPPVDPRPVRAARA
ncbi:MAG: hypothetical protein O3B31_08180 [Chloroflexi bacterium]|nr:hypothetical protein [Chloroflexota bacterium]